MKKSDEEDEVQSKDVTEVRFPKFLGKNIFKSFEFQFSRVLAENPESLKILFLVFWNFDFSLFPKIYLCHIKSLSKRFTIQKINFEGLIVFLNCLFHFQLSYGLTDLLSAFRMLTAFLLISGGVIQVHLKLQNIFTFFIAFRCCVGLS